MSGPRLLVGVGIFGGVTERSVKIVAVVAALAAAAVVLAGITRVVNDPFGDSHDGRNGAVWARASREFREGPIESRLGARFEGGTYANHPPLIVIETAIAEALAGTRRGVTRAPAWAGSLVGIALVVVASRRLGFGWASTTIGLALAVTSPLFVGYAAMLDTPVTSLPFGVALLVAWLSATSHRSLRQLAAAGVCAALCAVSGWQAFAFASLLGLSSLRTPRTRAGIAILGGAAVGAALLVAHQFWVWGSLSELQRHLLNRSTLGTGGDSSVSWASGVTQQLEWFVDLVNPSALLLGVVGLCLLIRDGGDRRVAALTTAGTVVLYDVMLAGGAAFHDYWSYWSMLPLALGSARTVDWVLQHPARARRPILVAAAMGASLLTGISLVDDEVRITQGRGVSAGLLARRATVPEIRALAMAVPTAWIPYERGRGSDSDTIGCQPPGCLVLLDAEAADELFADFDDVRVIDQAPPYALVDPDEARRALESSPDE